MRSPGKIFDLHDIPSTGEFRDSADIIIIGTGAAGATAARVLTERGFDVVMLEEGPNLPNAGFPLSMGHAFKTLWRDLGFQSAQGRAFVPILQGCALGGTTVINGAIIHRIPERILNLWQEQKAIDDWYSMANLEQVFGKLDQELSVTQTPESVLGNNGRFMRKGVEAIGAKGNAIFRVAKDCQGSARCNQGCPTGRKQSMHLTYLPRSVQKGARIYTSCKALKIKAHNGKAKYVVAQFQDSLGRHKGPSARFEAKIAIIVAASAIQTPLLLQASGLGKTSQLVGERFQAHPGTSVMGMFDAPVTMWSGATQGFETTHFWQEKMKFETVAVPLEIGAARLPGFGPALIERMAKFGHIAQWGVQIRAQAHGSVKRGLFGNKTIRFDLTNHDVRVFKRGVERLVHMMFQAGAREVYPGVAGLPEVFHSPDKIAHIHDLPDTPQLFHCIAAHLFGTAVMNPNPRLGVVGSDAQSHELPGLYVADSSIFPSNLGVNPQHSICAFSWRIAERIAERHGS
jgi:choline dehydrogenase-like flavoprotein